MRVAAWQSALEEVFFQARSRPFRWGRHDCFQFAARCVSAITGDDRRALFPGYQSRAEAEAILQKFGGARGLIVHALGESKPKAFASDGDIVLVEFGNGLQPAICRGLECFAPGRRNLVHRRTLDALEAWTV